MRYSPRSYCGVFLYLETIETLPLTQNAEHFELSSALLAGQFRGCLGDDARHFVVSPYSATSALDKGRPNYLTGLR